ncbi:hypothetical protein TOPH_07314 [Tolypocladium ophioglossoides CBS 100239]|uniref:Uncharacterized protein n=1 Tax=Tolypocladium ophioglossoides (strain CBS 100239) TaxID=1163406 RepID=A0A0L0N1Y3_TOLOC|nr:hypothetical protein TOPH_07314 [Tolypocladium ophioglossoides CBS 100239]
MTGAVGCLTKEFAVFCPSLKVLIAEPGCCRTKAFSNNRHVEARVPDCAQCKTGVRQFEAIVRDAEQAVTRMIEIV